MQPRRIAAVLLALILVAGACGSDDDDGENSTSTTASTSSTDPGPGAANLGPNGFVPDPIEWDGCGELDCATLTVPVDYDDVEGERLTLQVIRVAATGERIGSLFVNPGGPGASAAEFAAILPLLLPEAIGERFDVVGVDPRGVGGSAPIDCGMDAALLYAADPTMEDEGDRAAFLAISQEYVDGCLADAADLLPHLGTRDVARDMDSVRAAMGDAQLSYLGASYGTAIGQVYAELFPTRVRAMVLDGVLELGPSGLELAEKQAAGFEQALARYGDHCRGSEECQTANDPVGAIEEMFALAESGGGIPAPDSSRDAGPGEVNIGVAGALYSESLWEQLDRAVAEALAGDGDRMVSLANAYLQVGSFEVYFAVNCLDFAWPAEPQAFLDAGKAAAATSPHFGEAIVTDYLRCAYWPGPAEPLTAVTAPGTPPILVISTTGDPATPYEAGVAVADRLEQGVLLTHEGDGHGVIGTGNACIDAHLSAYLIDGAVPNDGTVCR